MLQNYLRVSLATRMVYFLFWCGLLFLMILELKGISHLGLNITFLLTWATTICVTTIIEVKLGRRDILISMGFARVGRVAHCPNCGAWREAAQ
jgi:hypothetical protein